MVCPSLLFCFSFSEASGLNPESSRWRLLGLRSYFQLLVPKCLVCLIQVTPVTSPEKVLTATNLKILRKAAKLHVAPH